jgi:hypothetical protein
VKTIDHPPFFLFSVIYGKSGSMRRVGIISIVFLVFLFLAGNASALTTIDSCQTLSSVGETYVLNASIDDSVSSTCFSFSANNMTLDCNGFTINMTNIPSTVFNLGSVENAVVKNCIIYAQNSDDNTLVLTNGVSNLTYHNNSAYIVGKSWSGNANDNVVSITGNYFNQSCYHEIVYEPSLRITGQYINYDNNVFDGYCNNITSSGTNIFQTLNHSMITNSIFNIAGKADEPLTFHGIHGNVIDNITINATNLQYANAGMVGRFCCGTDNIFRNSRLYLNWTFNLYAVNSIGNNMTWDNIQYTCYRTCDMKINDYDNVTIKNSVFSGNTFTISGKSTSPANNTLYNLRFQNVTVNNSISFNDAIAGYNWSVMNSRFGKGISLVNVSSAFLLESNYLNYSSGNNLQLDSLSNYNMIFNNTFNVGNVTDSGTGNIYCVNGTGNTYTNGSAYSGSSLGTCFSQYVDSCQTLSSNQNYVLNASITANVASSCLNMSSGGNVTIDGNGFGIIITGTGRAISLTGAVNVTITNLTINGTYVATYGIYLSNVNVSGIDNVNVTAVKSGSGGGAVYGTDLNNFTFRNSYLYSNNGTGFSFRRVNHLDIINNVFLHDVNYAATNGFFHNVSFLNFSNNNVSKPAVLGDQLVHCNGWINDTIIDNNTFVGKCTLGSLCSTFSVPNRVEIKNNMWNVSCRGVNFGSLYGSGGSYVPLDGNLSIHNNIINVVSASFNPCVALTINGINNNLMIFNNTCNSEWSGILITIVGNTSSIYLHDNIYNYISSNLSHSAYGLQIHRTDNFAVGNLTINNENMISSFSTYGMDLYNMSANISNSNISGYCAGIRAYGRFAVNPVLNIYNSRFNPTMLPCVALNVTYGEILILFNQTINLYGSSGINNVKISNNAILNLFNTTGLLNITNVTDSGLLNAYWNLNVINPLLANVSIYDLQNNLISSFSGNNSLWVRQFFQNASGRTNTTPNSIQLSKSGYHPKTDSINMNTNKDYTISMSLIVPVIDPSSVTGQLVLTLGFGIMGLFAILTLLGFGYLESTGKPDPETIAKIMIGVVIIILMIVAVWTGLVTPP